MGLNKSQKSSLEIALVCIDQTISEMEQLLSAPGKGLMFEIVDDTKNNEKELLREMAKTAKREITELKSNFGLNEEFTSIKGILLGKFSYCWSTLEEMRFNNLGNFGKVDPSVEPKYEPHIDKLSKLFWDA